MHEPHPDDSSVVEARGLGFEDQYVGCEGWEARYGRQEVSQFRGAELIAERWGISREAMEVYSLESHRRALTAQTEGRFMAECIPVGDFRADETVRADSTLERMAGLATLRPWGRVTAAVASQISDGAAAVLVCSEDVVKRYNLAPRARIHQLRSRRRGARCKRRV